VTPEEFAGLLTGGNIAPLLLAILTSITSFLAVRIVAT